MGEVHKKNKQPKKPKKNKPPKQERAKKAGEKGKRPNPFDRSRITAMARLILVNPARSVGMRLFLIFFIGMVAFVVILGLVSYNKARDTIEGNAAKANQQTIIQTSEKLDIILSQYDKLSRQIFYDNELQTLLSDATNTGISDYDRFTITKEISDKLMNQIIQDNNIRGIYIVPKDKSSLISAGNTGIDSRKLLEERWLDQLTDNKKVLWRSTINESSGAYFTVAHAMGSVNKLDEKYIFVMMLNVSVLNEQLEGVNLGANSQLQLLTSDNKVVSSSVDKQIGTLSTLSFMNKEKGETKTASLFTKDINGREVLAVYNTLNINDWRLVATIQTAELTKDARGILNITLWAAIIDSIIAVLLGIWMVRMIAKPISSLNLLMKEGAKGKLNVRATHLSKDEIGQLSVSFNEMMEQITHLVQQTSDTAQDVLHTAEELSDASRKTAVSAKEIAAATEEIANGASSLAAEAERGSDLTSNISRQMQIVIQSNEEMGESARHVEHSSELGTKHLGDLLDKTRQTEDMTRAMMRKVDGLKDTTSSVVKVLDVLQNITKQTNILSLNATIEAARAGSAGRGFMVVADEIRQLADQSRRSIDMVSQITDRIMKEMNETVQVLMDANPLFQAQMDSVRETNDIFDSVQRQMGDFIQSLDSVTASIEGLNQSQIILSEAMSNVSAVAEESSATSQEVASLSNEQQSVSNQLVNLSGKLENVSSELKETLSRFKL